ncbi:uncharacterized protein B0P05DRAFT_541512 [Gilbertella persicaria]|uniref:uncharacterized protein n=1 Tax=Gilbertella persicaria TaxID=101096 RepID=UPI0022209BF6|nr:uncharacterized protein B0P05DRAFT_541512 [Gilbertella persicaria]KAI8079665.1 hypothetical protein B0P05DRAFT_541512 [Gilbertella persicaria]
MALSSLFLCLSTYSISISDRYRHILIRALNSGTSSTTFHAACKQDCCFVHSIENTLGLSVGIQPALESGFFIPTSKLIEIYRSVISNT